MSAIDASDDPAFPPRLIAWGGAVAAGFGLVFALWAGLAPIASAVVAPGVVSAASGVRVVKPLADGVVAAVHARAGDRVAAGALLIELDSVAARARLRRLQGQLVEAEASAARLEAERSGSEEIAFPASLAARAAEPGARSAMEGQRAILRARRDQRAEAAAVTEQRIARTREEIAGVEGQFAAGERRRALLMQELAQVESLLARELVPLQRALKLRGEIAELDGALGALRAEAARAEQGVLQTRLERGARDAAMLAEATEALRAERARSFELAEQIVAAEEAVRAAALRAPVAGVVVGARIPPEGEVVAGGEPLLEIVPSGDAFVVEARVDPRDIEAVRPGLTARVRLTAFGRRSQTPLTGLVSGVSADRIDDPRTGLPYYRAAIAFAPDDPATAALIAGMGAEVFIETGARSVVSYLLAPITRSIERGLREQ